MKNKNLFKIVFVFFGCCFFLLGCEKEKVEEPIKNKEEAVIISQDEYRKKINEYANEKGIENKNFNIEITSSGGISKKLLIADGLYQDTPLGGWVRYSEGEELRVFLENKRERPVAVSFSEDLKQVGKKWVGLPSNTKIEIKTNSLNKGKSFFIHVYLIEAKKREELKGNEVLLDVDWKNKNINEEIFVFTNESAEKPIKFYRKIVNKNDIKSEVSIDQAPDLIKEKSFIK